MSSIGDTEKLFMLDPYIKEFYAKVIKIDGNKIYLDKTAFYPESGGQIGDTGYLDNLMVIDTRYDDEKNIYHLIKDVQEGNVQEGKINIGEIIVGRINWDRRYLIMRNHAASHIMEHFLHQIFGELKLVGTSVNDRHDSSTYLFPEAFDKDKLIQVEKLSNDFISKGFEIERWEDENMPGWWYWSAGDITIHCGGTHPRNTKEIGQISIKRKSGGKGKEKLYTSIV